MQKHKQTITSAPLGKSLKSAKPLMKITSKQRSILAALKPENSLKKLGNLQMLSLLIGRTFSTAAFKITGFANVMGIYT
jgi:hypothetical protein